MIKNIFSICFTNQNPTGELWELILYTSHTTSVSPEELSFFYRYFFLLYESRSKTHASTTKNWKHKKYTQNSNLCTSLLLDRIKLKAYSVVEVYKLLYIRLLLLLNSIALLLVVLLLLLYEAFIVVEFSCFSFYFLFISVVGDSRRRYWQWSASYSFYAYTFFSESKTGVWNMDILLPLRHV